MAYQRPKICLLFAGGTRLIGRSKTPIEVHREDQIAAWLAEVPEVQIIAKIDPVFVQAETQATRLPETWSILAQHIKRRYTQYDGFIVLQPIDVLAYSGAALSFIMQHLGKPIVLTGSQQSHQLGGEPASGEDLHDFRRLGLRANLINAVQVVTMDIGEVAVMFGNRLVRGTQARRSFDEAASLRETFVGELGKVDFGIKLNDHRQRRRKTGIVVYPKMEKNLAVLRMQPGSEPIKLVEATHSTMTGIFLQTDGISLDTAQLGKLENFAAKRNCPLVLFQAPRYDQDAYPHLFALRGVTEESAIVKVMWVLGQTRSLTRIRELLSANMSGEFSSEQEAAV